MQYNDEIAGGGNELYWIADPSKRFAFDPFTAGSVEAARAKARAYRDAEVARREKIAGRPIALNEHRRGTVDRGDATAAKFQPELKPRGKFDDLIESLEPQADNKAFTAKSREKRLYESAKQLQAAEDDKAESETALASHLADPRVAAQLAELRRLQEAARWNPAISQEEWESIGNAIEQVSHPQGEPAAGRGMVRSLLEAEDARNQAKIAQLEATMATARGLLESAKASMPPVRIAATGNTVEEKLHSVFMAMPNDHPAHDVTYEALQQVRQGNPAAAEALLEQYGS